MLSLPSERERRQTEKTALGYYKGALTSYKHGPGGEVGLFMYLLFKIQLEKTW